MRVLLTTRGSSGHVLPLAPFGHVCLRAGHEVMVAAAVVCHGGYGSTLGALRHGVPLVVMPLFSSDQWVNAAAVARAGAGRIADASDTLPPVDAAVDVLAAISAGHAAEPPVPAA